MNCLIVYNYIWFINNLELIENGINDFQIIATKYSTATECKEKIVNTGISFSPKFYLLYFRLLLTSSSPIVVIGSNLLYGKETVRYFQERLEEYGINNYVTYIMKESTLAEGHNAVSVIRSTLYPSIYINIY